MSSVSKHKDYIEDEQPYWEVEPLECKICSMIFLSRSELSRHLFSHAGVKFHQCELCTKKFMLRSDLYKHLLFHTVRKYNRCEICYEKFKDKGVLLRHLLTHADDKPHGCDICFKRFRYENHLLHHLRSHLGERRHRWEMYSGKSTEEDSLSGCAFGDEPGKMWSKKHRRCEPREKCVPVDEKDEVCMDKSVWRGEHRLSPSRGDGKMCIKKISQRSELIKHLTSPMDDKNKRNLIQFPQTVNFPPISACDNGQMNLSKRVPEGEHTKHTGPSTERKLHSCEICNKGFTRKENLAVHLLIHSGEKPHTCEVCLRKFRRKDSMLYHMRIHTGERPHVCELCHKRFMRRTHLSNHLLKSHPEEERHECPTCHKTFLQNGELVRHQLTDMNKDIFECKMCPKKFARKDNLSKHLHTHTEETLPLVQDLGIAFETDIVISV